VLADRIVRPVVCLAALGPHGLARAAALSVSVAHEAHERICSIEGFEPRFRAPFFNEFVVETECEPEDVAEALLESNVLGALPLQRDYPEMDHCVLFAATERRTRADIALLHHALDLLTEADIASDFAVDDEDG
jgi:glycine dehydrogenase subunit 1